MNSKKLIRLTAREIDEKYFYFIKTFDIESEIGMEMQINPKLYFFKGMSQIFQDNTLYLCGNDQKSDEFSSSFLYSINVSNQPYSIAIEVNSCYPHHFPTLSILRKEYLVVVGGLNSKKCEYYSISTKRWKNLPDLPEERYQSNVICDNASNAIFIIGGLNSRTNQCCMSILKLNVNLCVKWDTIVLSNEESNLMAKSNCCVVRRSNDNILLLGGINNTNLSAGSDLIIEIDTKKKKISPVLSQQKLNCNVKFKNLREGAENTAGKIYAFDDEDDNLIYKIDSNFSQTIRFNPDYYKSLDTF